VVNQYGNDLSTECRDDAPDQQPSALVTSAPAFVAYRLTRSPEMRLVPATSSRAWMDATPGRFAQRCLPLLIANQSGWLVLNSHAIRATWDGGPSPESLHVECLSGEPPCTAASHFGCGILTWTLPYLFRTPPGYNLLVRGPANWPKDGLYPLEGVVETDWAVATFTMNWQITRPGLTVTFDVDEPICMLVPQPRSVLEAMQPVIYDIADSKHVDSAHQQWLHSRTMFLRELRHPTAAPTRDTWQRHYFRGTSPSGHAASQHQTRLNIRPFADYSTKHVHGRRVQAPAMKTRSIGMPHPSFGPQDLDGINRVLAHYPEVEEVIRMFTIISEHAVYPIQSFDDLVAACGGETATVTVLGRQLRLTELRPAIPAYYFPIGSENDLIAKLADVRARGFIAPWQTTGDDGIEWGVEVDGPPPDTEPPDERLRDLPHRLGVPSVIGLKTPE
jgi:Family of unknown function (DUF6065)